MAGVGTHSEGVPIASLADLTFSDQYQCVCGAVIGSRRPPGSAGQSAPSSYTWPSHIAPDTMEQALARTGFARAYSVLAILRTHGAPSDEASPRVLLDATFLTTGGLTNLLDRMEKAGCVKRRPERRTRDRGPPRGLSLINRVVEEVGRVGRALVSELAPQEREQLAMLLGHCSGPSTNHRHARSGARHRAGCARRLSTRSARGAWAPRVRSLSYGPPGVSGR